MCSRTRENNKDKVGPIIWDTLYHHHQSNIKTSMSSTVNLGICTFSWLLQNKCPHSKFNIFSVWHWFLYSIYCIQCRKKYYTVGVIKNCTLVFVHFSAQGESILKISVPIIKRRSWGFQNTPNLLTLNWFKAKLQQFKENGRSPKIGVLFNFGSLSVFCCFLGH